MQRAETFAPFVEFLGEHMGENDDDLTVLMDAIADTLGDMFGYQSDRHQAVQRFVARLQAAADAAGADQVMSRN